MRDGHGFFVTDLPQRKIILFVSHTCPLRRKSIGSGFFSRGFFQQLFSGIPADKERWLSYTLHTYHKEWIKTVWPVFFLTKFLFNSPSLVQIVVALN
jgi:hypothetical protein